MSDGESDSKRRYVVPPYIYTLTEMRGHGWKRSQHIEKVPGSIPRPAGVFFVRALEGLLGPVFEGRGEVKKKPVEKSPHGNVTLWVSVLRYEDGFVELRTPVDKPHSACVDLFGQGVRIIGGTIAREEGQRAAAADKAPGT
jgi:hypothetical protein